MGCQQQKSLAPSDCTMLLHPLLMSDDVSQYTRIDPPQGLQAHGCSEKSPRAVHCFCAASSSRIFSWHNALLRSLATHALMSNPYLLEVRHVHRLLHVILPKSPVRHSSNQQHSYSSKPGFLRSWMLWARQAATRVT